MRYHELVDEVVGPSNEMKSQTYYHGTSKLEAAKAIMQHGLIPQEVSNKYSSKRAALAPVEGMIYMTPSIKYATIYALGGNFVGHNPMPSVVKGKADRYGFVFVVPGERLNQLQPDEDEIGHATRAAYDHLKAWKTDPDMKRHGRDMDNLVFSQAIADSKTMCQRLVWLAQQRLTRLQQERLFSGYEYNIVAQAGKKMVRYMTDDMKRELIHMGCHVAHQGAIMPSECWKIDKMRSAELGFLAEHFFDVAQKVWENKGLRESVFHRGEFKPPHALMPVDLTVLQNPSKGELAGLMRRIQKQPGTVAKEARAVWDGNDLFVWDSGLASHDDFDKVFGISGMNLYLYEGYFKMDSYYLRHPDMKTDAIETINQIEALRRLYGDFQPEDVDGLGFIFKGE